MKIEILKSQIESLDVALNALFEARTADQMTLPICSNAVADLQIMRCEKLVELHTLQRMHTGKSLPRLSSRDHAEFVIRDDGYYVSL